MVYIVLGHGFEEIEALAPCDILRRGGIDVMLAGIGGKTVKGGHGIEVTADCLVEDIDLDKADMIVFPGGSVGVESIADSAAAMTAMKNMYEKGKLVAAICAAPTLLAKLGILEGKKAVCYPGMEEEMAGAEVVQESGVVEDGNVITARAAGSSIDFGLAILERLKDKETAENVKNSIYY